MRIDYPHGTLIDVKDNTFNATYNSNIAVPYSDVDIMLTKRLGLIDVRSISSRD